MVRSVVRLAMSSCLFPEGAAFEFVLHSSVSSSAAMDSPHRVSKVSLRVRDSKKGKIEAAFVLDIAPGSPACVAAAHGSPCGRSEARDHRCVR